MTAEVTGLLNMLRDIKGMLMFFGVVSEKRKITRNGKIMHRIRMIPSETMEFGKLIYGGCLKYKMKRKHDIYSSHVERLNEVTVDIPKHNHREGIRLSVREQVRKR